MSSSSKASAALKFAGVGKAIHNCQTPPAKAYNDIPRKKSLMPSQLGLIMSGGPGYLHEHCDKRHKELGPIFREKLGANELVFVADTDMFRTVIANEGPSPHHSVPEAWLLFNQVNGINRGLFFQIGEPWIRLRRAFNKVLLADPAKITRFSNEILTLNKDLFDSWAAESNKKGGSVIDIFDVKAALCEWSIEATGLMLFGRRMGCVPSSGMDTASKLRAEKLVQNVSDMFRQTSVFQVVPPKLAMKLNLPSWRKFETASTNMIQIASSYASEFIERAKADDSSPSIVGDLLDMQLLTDDEISRTMVDLIIAAADTTSNALQWILYSISKHPDTQSKLYNEVKHHGLQSQSNDTSRGDLKSPYLHAVVREVSRLYPTAPFIARTLDHPINLGGYDIPANIPIVLSLYTTSRKEEYFRHASNFEPERWLRNLGGTSASLSYSRNSAYATLPFGVGSRMCIGRRMADLEIDLLIASLVDQFVISLKDSSRDARIKLQMVLCPDRPIGLRFKARQSPQVLESSLDGF